MNEENKNNAESSCLFCKGGKMVCNAHGMHRGCRIFRWILGLLILWVVFMGGVKIGELKGSIENGREFGRHNRDSYRGYNMPMMQRGGMFGGQNQWGGYGYGYKNNVNIQQQAPQQELQPIQQ